MAAAVEVGGGAQPKPIFAGAMSQNGPEVTTSLVQRIRTFQDKSTVFSRQNAVGSLIAE
jgi:hypothetical protein